jgi:hypothetical protein
VVVAHKDEFVGTDLCKWGTLIEKYLEESKIADASSA